MSGFKAGLILLAMSSASTASSLQFPDFGPYRGERPTCSEIALELRAVFDDDEEEGQCTGTLIIRGGPTTAGSCSMGADRWVHVAAYTVKGDSFVADKPRFWSDKQVADLSSFPGFDVAPDGKRVLALFASEDPKPETILHLLLNLDTELRHRAPAHRK